MSKDTGLWVVAHSKCDKLPKVVFELIGKARELGDKVNEKVIAIILGSGLDTCIHHCFQYGADDIIYVDEENLRDYDANSHANVLEMLVKKYRPAVMLFGADSIGRDLAPRIAVRLETGISADCVDLDMQEIDGRTLLIQKKPYLNGEVIVDILCKEKRPQIATVKPGIIPVKEAGPSKAGHALRERCQVDDVNLLTKVLKFTPAIACSSDICQAQIVVAGGRGFQEKKEFQKLYELAELLGGVVGSTRPLVQDGWLTEDCQIGQSGRCISPKLYIAFGISGSAMHTCGVVKPGTVIAINEDPDAPIFSIADYGVVGDCNKILSELIENLNPVPTGS